MTTRTTGVNKDGAQPLLARGKVAPNRQARLPEGFIMVVKGNLQPAAFETFAADFPVYWTLGRRSSSMFTVVKERSEGPVPESGLLRKECLSEQDER